MKEWGNGGDTEGESETQLYLSQSSYEDRKSSALVCNLCKEKG